MQAASEIRATKAPSPEEILSRARGLVPALRERARQTEERRALPPETMQDLYDTGLLRILQPARYGGYEMDWPLHLEAARIIARACPSTAWIVSVVGAHAAIAARLNKRCQDDIWGDGEDILIATATAPSTGGIYKAEDGYRADGVWRFASGVDHSRWVMITGPVRPDDGSEPERGRAALVRVLMPRSDVEIVDGWFVAGMSGTGSKDIKCSDVFIPEYRTTSARASFASSPPGAEVNPDSYLYEVDFMPYFGSSLLGPIVGCAEGAYQDYVEITKARISVMLGSNVAENVPVQQRLAESAGEIKAARLLLEASNELLHGRGVARQTLVPAELVEQARDRTMIAKLCVSAVTRLVGQMGALGIFDENPVQRHFRDLNAMATQIAVNYDRNMTTFGRWELGLPTGDPRIDDAPNQSG